MADYKIEQTTKDFKVTAFGVSLSNDFSDWAGMKKITDDFKAELKSTGKLEALQEKADEWQYQANDNGSLHGTPYRFFGVEGEFPEVDGAEVLNFPAGDYLIVSGEGNDREALFDQLTGKVFGGLLQQVTDYHYVGPNNVTGVKKKADGTFVGEIWLPVTKNQEV